MAQAEAQKGPRPKSHICLISDFDSHYNYLMHSLYFSGLASTSSRKAAMSSLQYLTLATGRGLFGARVRRPSSAPEFGARVRHPQVLALSSMTSASTLKYFYALSLLHLWSGFLCLQPIKSPATKLGPGLDAILATIKLMTMLIALLCFPENLCSYDLLYDFFIKQE